MGPPGSGKGTQSELLAEEFDLYHLETSEILEENMMKAEEGKYQVVKGKRYYFSDEVKKWKTGELVSDELVTFWLNNKIKELAKKGENLVLSAFPRTLYEGKESTPLLKKLYGKENVWVFELKLSAKESIWRNSHRRICELMRHPVLYTKETAELKHCPLDGSKLLKRKGLDDPKTIKIRLKEYKERTRPVFDYLKKQGFKVKRINGEQPVAGVFKDTLKSLK